MEDLIHAWADLGKGMPRWRFQRLFGPSVTGQVEDPHVDYAVEDLRWTREVGLEVVARAHQPWRLN